MKKWLLICGVLGLVSCETIIDMDMPGIPPKLVVSAIFNKDSIPQATITRNRAIQQAGDYDAVTDALIQLDNAGNVVTLNETSEGKYQGDAVQALSGQVQFQATRDGYEGVSAICNVPSTPQMGAVTHEIIEREWDNAVRLGFKLNDPSDDNYYWLMIYKWGTIYQWQQHAEGWYEQVAVGTGFAPMYFSVTDPSFSGEYYDENGAFFNDFLFNGSNKNIEVEVDGWQFYEDIYENGEPDPDSTFTFDLLVEVRHIDKDLYDHGVSFEAYQYSNGEPFVQPVRVKSNIENGLGVFSVYAAASSLTTINYEPNQ